MEIIVELFPFIFGVLLGVSCERLGGLLRRWPVWVGGNIALGALATLCTGEYRVSLLYFIFDIGMVAVVSVGASLLYRAALVRR